MPDDAYLRMVVLHSHCAAVYCQSRVDSVISSKFIAKPHGQAHVRMCSHAFAFTVQLILHVMPTLSEQVGLPAGLCT